MCQTQLRLIIIYIIKVKKVLFPPPLFFKEDEVRISDLPKITQLGHTISVLKLTFDQSH